MSFFHKVQDKLAEGIERTKDEIIGRLNPDHRHDDPQEKEEDAVRTEINDSHRFQSFAGERDSNHLTHHIDGAAYMASVSHFLNSAKECIFILDWWLTPELYLRRGENGQGVEEEWRLDRVLERKANEGVKVFIVVYKEVTQTMTMGSNHTKHYLEGLSENIAVLRHPDHIGSKDSVEFWSHHEKLVIVDFHYACVGGLDLCFGRWDTQAHPQADVYASEWYKQLFPGQDYNNARIMDFQNVHLYASNALSRADFARMPWHDVHTTLVGPVVLDLGQHFIERWNEIRKRKYTKDPRVPILALPHLIDQYPNEAVARHPHYQQWKDMGVAFRQRWHRHRHPYADEDRGPNEEPEEGYHIPPSPGMHVQAVRSVSDWSQGVLTEHSIQNAYIQLISEAERFIYIENQFFISSTVTKGDQVVNQIARALVERVIRARDEDAPFKIVIVTPEVPAFSGTPKDSSSLKIIMAAQYRTINRGGHSIYETLRAQGIEPRDYIRFYNLRGYDRINTPPSVIKDAEARSGVTFQQAMVAHARIYIGECIKDQPEVSIRAADFDSGGSDAKDPKSDQDKDKSKEIEKVKVPATVEEARSILTQFEEGARAVLEEKGSFPGQVKNTLNNQLAGTPSLVDENWIGTEQEELDAFVSEEVYIHSKVMIIDDRRVIIGSANLNDRSQKGNGDSEIALVIEDNDRVQSSMGGQPWEARAFAAGFRRELWREHLGLLKAEEVHPPYMSRDEMDHIQLNPHTPAPRVNALVDCKEVEDPLGSGLDLWESTAKKNREVFTEIFRPIPSNLVRSWSAWENYTSVDGKPWKWGHVVPGMPLPKVKERLGAVKGSVVEMAIDFLIDEKEFCQGPDWDGLNPTLPIYI